MRVGHTRFGVSNIRSRDPACNRRCDPSGDAGILLFVPRSFKFVPGSFRFVPGSFSSGTVVRMGHTRFGVSNIRCLYQGVLGVVLAHVGHTRFGVSNIRARGSACNRRCDPSGAAGILLFVPGSFKFVPGSLKFVPGNFRFGTVARVGHTRFDVSNIRSRDPSCNRRCAAERKLNTSKGCQDFRLKAKARISP